MPSPRSQAVVMLSVLSVCLIATGASAQEWTRFHGPNGQGASPARGLPTTWSEKDYNFNVEIPGTGHSSPVIMGTKLFITTADKGTWSMMCLDSESGKTLWKKDYPQDSYKINKLSSFASSTPCVDDKHVYAPTSSDKDYYLMAWDHQGNEKWRYRMGPYISQHGVAASPVLYKDMVLLANEQDAEEAKDGEAQSFLVAVDRNTGKEKWKLPRKPVLAAYVNPAIYQPKKGKPLIICANKGNGLYAVDPDTGKQVWESPNLYRLRTIMSPIFVDDIVITSCGSGGGKSNYVVACRITPKGPEELWKMTKAAPYVVTPVVHNGVVYLVGDGGILTAVEVKTGKELYVSRIEGKSGGSSSSFFSSPVVANGHIYAFSRQGDAYVIKAGSEYDPVSVIPLGDEVHASPAIANGHLYIRTFHRLMSVGGKKSL